MLEIRDGLRSRFMAVHEYIPKIIILLMFHFNVQMRNVKKFSFYFALMNTGIHF